MNGGDTAHPDARHGPSRHTATNIGPVMAYDNGIQTPLGAPRSF